MKKVKLIIASLALSFSLVSSQASALPTKLPPPGGAVAEKPTFSNWIYNLFES